MEKVSCNKGVFLSIIIPVYNAELFLEETVSSIQRQGIDDYEIILVNDGSTDNSLRLCEYLSEGFDNVKIISQKNKGVSAARNAGLKISCGKWVYFVDADDQICDSSLKRLEFLIRDSDKTFDIVKVSHTVFHDSIVNSQEFENTANIVEHYSSINEYLKGKKFNIAHSLWLHLFLRSHLVDNNIWFTEGLKYCEDIEFVFKSLVCSKGIYFTNIETYKYFVREGSAMSNFYKAENALLHLNVLENFAQYVDENKSVEFFSYVKKYLVKSFLSCLALSHCTRDEFVVCRSKYKRIFKEFHLYSLHDKLLWLSFFSFPLGLRVLRARMEHLKNKK